MVGHPPLEDGLTSAEIKLAEARILHKSLVLCDALTSERGQIQQLGFVIDM